MLGFLKGFKHLYPCKHCRKHFEKDYDRGTTINYDRSSECLEQIRIESLGLSTAQLREPNPGKIIIRLQHVELDEEMENWMFEQRRERPNLIILSVWMIRIIVIRMYINHRGSNSIKSYYCSIISSMIKLNLLIANNYFIFYEYPSSQCYKAVEYLLAIVILILYNYFLPIKLKSSWLTAQRKGSKNWIIFVLPMMSKQY